jgi:hypothetical protein
MVTSIIDVAIGVDIFKTFGFIKGSIHNVGWAILGIVAWKEF